MARITNRELIFWKGLWPKGAIIRRLIAEVLVLRRELERSKSGLPF